MRGFSIRQGPSLLVQLFDTGKKIIFCANALAYFAVASVTKGKKFYNIEQQVLSFKMFVLNGVAETT